MMTKVKIKRFDIYREQVLVSQTSNRVMAVADGAVIAIGEPSEIQNHPDVLRAYLGD